MVRSARVEEECSAWWWVTRVVGGAARTGDDVGRCRDRAALARKEVAMEMVSGGAGAAAGRGQGGGAAAVAGGWIGRRQEKRRLAATVPMNSGGRHGAWVSGDRSGVVEVRVQ